MVFGVDCAHSMSLPDPDKTRRAVGQWLLVIAVLVGAFLLVVQFLVPPLFMDNPIDLYAAMFIGGLLAFPAGAMYLTVPRLLDRYDPEPAYALVGCLLWGGIVACAFSALVNTGMAVVGEVVGGPGGGDILGAVVSAPIVEEGFKGLGIWGVFFFLRREFDGVVDGIIYATFVALGFATIENVVYYSGAASHGQDVLAVTFVLRGVLAPWGHPVYTSMTGIGFGLARETKRAWVRWTAPVIGYLGAVFLHFVWNASATFGEGVVWLLLLPIWLLFVLGFVVMIIVLVARRGKIIRQHLLDEVALGTISQQELELVCSAFGLFKARLSRGPAGAELVRATARLALSKWHTTRAMEGQHRTVSMDFIAPLRRRIAELRASTR